MSIPTGNRCGVKQPRRDSTDEKKPALGGLSTTRGVYQARAFINFSCADKETI